MARARAPLHALLAAALLAAAPLPAQPSPSPRAHGVVRGPDGEPVAGAEVRIWQRAGDGAARPAPPPTRTDGRGRWAVLPVGPGRWEIEIEADGFLPARGWFQVFSSGATPPVEVELRSLAERSPRFTEGSPLTIRGWLDRADALLDQGRPAEARAELEKAAAALPPGERPPVLERIARSRFLEGDVDGALADLEEALALGPEGGEDGELRLLFLSLLKSAGRGDEAQERLERVAAERRRRALAPPQPQPEPPTAAEVELPPLEEPSPGRIGEYRTSFATASPLSTLEVYRGRFGVEAERILALDPGGGAHDPAGESFQVHVPESYAPRGDEPGSDRPGGGWGLLVWISPTPFGGFRSPAMGEALAEHRLIWIGAHDSGNGRPTWARVALALDAAHHGQRLYDVDPERVFVAGYSGGGRLATSLALLYPEVFRGALALYGADYFDPLPVPDRPGSFWPAKFPRPDEATLRRLERDSRFVLLTGELDFNRAQTKQTWRAMEEEGFRHLLYLEIPGADHYSAPDRSHLDRAFAALDG